MPSLLSRQDALQMALVGGSHVRQAERHANVVVWRTLATAHARRLEKLLRCGPVEPWDVDADVQPTILAWMGSHARRGAVAVHGPRFMKLVSGLGNELLSAGRPSPCVLLRETCHKARLQVVPERLPRYLGKVSGPPRESP